MKRSSWSDYQKEIADEDASLSTFVQQVALLTDMDRGEESDTDRVALMTVHMAKGLEFDHVIVPDAQAEVYPDTPLARRRLYTALSRAMHRVTVLAQGPLTPMLATR
mgnify:CR=1 FL=1